jgi:tetratricopeptide (TPR) repeat protein
MALLYTDHLLRGALAIAVSSAALLFPAALAAQTSEQQAAQLTADCAGNDPNLVITGCTAAIQAIPVSPATESLLAIVYSNRGWAYMSTGQWPLALADLNQAVQADPTYYYAWKNLGVYYNSQKQYDLAIPDFTKALSLKAGDAETSYDLAFAYFETGQYDLAVQNYTQTIGLDPNIELAYVNRGVSYMRLGQFGPAIQDFTKAISLKPGDANAYFNRAESYDEGNPPQYPLAIQDYSQVITLNPSNASAWNGRCWDRAITGDLENALADCNQSLQLASDKNTLDSRGFVYLKMNNAVASISDYNAALAIDPKMASSLYGRGMAERLQGNQAASGADIAAAEAILPGIAGQFAQWGVPAPQP